MPIQMCVVIQSPQKCAWKKEADNVYQVVDFNGDIFDVLRLQIKGILQIMEICFETSSNI